MPSTTVVSVMKPWLRAPLCFVGGVMAFGCTSTPTATQGSTPTTQPVSASTAPGALRVKVISVMAALDPYNPQVASGGIPAEHVIFTVSGLPSSTGPYLSLHRDRLPHGSAGWHDFDGRWSQFESVFDLPGRRPSQWTELCGAAFRCSRRVLHLHGPDRPLAHIDAGKGHTTLRQAPRPLLRTRQSSLEGRLDLLNHIVWASWLEDGKGTTGWTGRSS